ncbi:MAG: tetratricopeptide repeat protein [Gammaproteobacteria bacterium]
MIVLKFLKYSAAVIPLTIGITACDQDNSTKQLLSESAATITSNTSTRSGAHNQSDPHSQLSAEKRVLVALQHLKEGRRQLALTVLDESIQQFPNNSELLSVRASILLEQGNATLALNDLEKAVQLAPEDLVLRINRAQAYRSFGRIREALDDLNFAIKKQPALVSALFNRGAIYFSSGDLNKALTDFNACIKAQPLQAAPYFNRAAVYEAMNKKQLAIADLKHFIELSSSDSWKQTAQKLLDQWQGKKTKPEKKS